MSVLVSKFSICVSGVSKSHGSTFQVKKGKASSNKSQFTQEFEVMNIVPAQETFPFPRGQNLIVFVTQSCLGLFTFWIVCTLTFAVRFETFTKYNVFVL
jgi:hypothetical protein